MNRQLVLLILFIVILATIGFLWLRYSQTPPTAEVETGFGARLVELRRLKDLKLDIAVFQDKFFRSLELPREVPEPELKVGRNNPFAPF